ncbi:MAG: ATP-dependent 6-phosphofructokinase, partial [Candidatus Micrarchaeota archaeon]
MKKIGVLTSGGDSPGMNACVRAVVRTAVSYDVKVVGFLDGFTGLVHNRTAELDSRSVSNIIQLGGSILRAGRCKEFLQPEYRKTAYETARELSIEGLIVIGGNGSFQGAHKLFLEHQLPIVGVPGTIDNDVYGSDTIGFDTAINTALSSIDRIRDTSSSHGMPFFVEVMGREAGFIALESAIAGGAEAVLIPEVLYDLEEATRVIKSSHE